MNLTETKVDELAIICYIDSNEKNIEALHGIMRLGVVPGLEIRKLSQIATCAEYRVEGTSGRLVISKDLSDYIIVDLLDEDG